MSSCPECQVGSLAQRPSGFWACTYCGHLSLTPPEPEPVPETQPEPPKPGMRPGTLDQPAEPMVVDGIVVPDQSEPVIGWRAWDVDTSPDSWAPVLRSVTKREHYWTPREAFHAVCNKRSKRNDPKHKPPMKGCTCGLYAAKTYPELVDLAYQTYGGVDGDYTAVGRVKLWGSVREGSQGWRAEWGYPETLYLPYEAWSELAGPLSESYGVPVFPRNLLAADEEGE